MKSAVPKHSFRFYYYIVRMVYLHIATLTSEKPSGAGEVLGWWGSSRESLMGIL